MLQNLVVLPIHTYENLPRSPFRIDPNAYSQEGAESMQYAKGKVYISGHSNSRTRIVLQNTMKASVIGTHWALYHQIPGYIESLYGSIQEANKDESTSKVEPSWNISDDFEADNAPFYNDSSSELYELLQQIYKGQCTLPLQKKSTNAAVICQESLLPENFDDIVEDCENNQVVIQYIDQDEDMDSDPGNLLQEHDSDFESPETGMETMVNQNITGHKRRHMN